MLRLSWIERRRLKAKWRTRVLQCLCAAIIRPRRARSTLGLEQRHRHRPDEKIPCPCPEAVNDFLERSTPVACRNCDRVAHHHPSRSRALQRVPFEVDEPFCHLFPVRRGDLENLAPSMHQLSENPDLEREHKLWSESRNIFNASLAEPESKAAQDQRQKTYFRGKAPSGAPAPEGHRSRLRLRPFKDSDLCKRAEHRAPGSGTLKYLIHLLFPGLPRITSDAFRTPLASTNFRGWTSTISLLGAFHMLRGT